MNIRIVCIGKLKEKYWKDALAEYAKRLSAYCTFTVTELKEDPRDDIEKEGEEILRHIGNSEHVITLEIRAKMKSSEELAQRIGDLGLMGKSDITFVIGGSNGLSAAVSKRADEKLSFSPMTFPHQMMRVILAEQVYRSFKILRGEAYHK